MISQDQVRELIGSQLLDSNGDKVGKVGQIFLDDETGQPEWATVNTGLFGSSESFVPLADANVTGDELRVPYAKSQVKDAPNVDVDAGHLDESQEAELYRHYGLQRSEMSADPGRLASMSSDRDSHVDGGHVDRDDDFDDSRANDFNRDTSGTTSDDSMTRSEETVHAGTEKVTSGKARLRKWVETEEVNVSVPVTKEKVRLETEPITDANRGDALDGPDISEEEHEVTLTEERPIVTKETVPVERVRLSTDTEQTEEQVTEQVRKERVEVDGDVDIDGGRQHGTS